MRAVLGVLILLALFAGAWFVHERFQTESRERARAAGGQPLAPVPEGFGHVVLGTPSGAEPLAPAAPSAPPSADAQAGSGAGGKVEPAPATPPGTQAGTVQSRVVARGETLSELCEQVYGTSRGDLVSALVKYNGLASGNAIREGQTILFPPVAELQKSPR